ncbi:MAG: DUF1559 domain-containing protein, partial [Planctomycetes bacterium]|nr:DUF1559 domain-containing protein [Planctomycetota bacterium]
IAVLVALLLPAVQKVRESANRMSCSNNVKQLALALHTYHDSYQKLPAGGTSTLSTSWLVKTLPYIEQGPLYNQWDFTKGYLDAPYANTAVGSNKLKVLYCPSGANVQSGNTGEVSGSTVNYTTHYYGNMGPTGTGLNGVTYSSVNAGSNSAESLQGVLGADTAVGLTDITDGTSNTFMVCERSQIEPSGVNSYRSWLRGCAGGCGACKNVTNPLNATYYNGAGNFNDISFGSMHAAGGANFGLADGGVHWINKGIDMNVYKAFASRNGGEAASLP